jgi:hypothetical protein
MKKYLIHTIVALSILTIGIGCTHRDVTVNVPGNQEEETSIGKGQSGRAMEIEGLTVDESVFPTQKQFTGEKNGLYVTYTTLKGGPAEDVLFFAVYFLEFESSAAALELWNTGQTCEDKAKHDPYYDANNWASACVDNGFPRPPSTAYNHGRLDLVAIKGNRILSVSCQISAEVNVDKTPKMHLLVQKAIDAYLR